jgi:hypothetical protein
MKKLSVNTVILAKYCYTGYTESKTKQKMFNTLNRVLRTSDNNVQKGDTCKTEKISQQPENCENRNDPDLVQAFLKKWWVELDFKAPNLPLSLWFKGSGCHYNSISIS